MRKLVLLTLLAASSAGLLAQSVQVPVMQTVIPGIGASWAGEVSGCPGVVANASSISRSNYYHSVGVTSASGTWSVALNYSDVSCLGPWVSFGSASQITQASNPSIAYGNGNHRYIQISITGNAVVTYTAMQTPFLSTSVGSVAFPVTLGQGGTGGTTSAVGLANLLSGNSQGNNTNKVQMAGAISGGPGTPLCIDVLGNDTTSGCAPSLPTGTQTQFLQIAPNTGNSTTLRMVSLPTVQASDYAFTPQAPGGSLSIGSNVIALAPVPVGVNGSDLNHYLYISGGSGTAESVIIIGGTAVSAAASGTVIVTCVNTHTGAWTVGPSAGGIIEAETAASAAGGGTVVVPNGTTVAYSHIPVPSNIRLTGQGKQSTIQLAPGAWPAGYTVPWVCNGLNYDCLIGTVDGASNVQIDNITIDMNGAYNAVNVTNGADILLLDCADCSVHDVTAIHSHHTGAFGFSLYGSGTSTNNVWDRNTIHGWGSGDSTTCGGGIFVQSSGGRITNNYADNLCDAAYVANGQVANPSTQISDVLIANNTWIYGASNSAVLLSGAFTDESANHTQFVGNTCSGPTNSGCFVIDTGGVGKAINDAIISGNRATSPEVVGACVNLRTDGTHLIQNVVIDGISCTGNGIIFSNTNGGSTTGFSSIDIKNSQISSPYGAGIFITNGAKHISIQNNTIRNGGSGGGAGIEVYYPTGNSDLSIQNNTINNIPGGDIWDATGAATVCNNTTDGVWNGQCNVATVNLVQASLSNGANENVTTTPTFPSSINLISSVAERVTGPTGGFSIGGFANGTAGRVIYLYNTTGQTMTINNQDSGSTPTNQITVPGGINVVTDFAIFIWDASLARWVMVSGSPTGSSVMANPMTTAGDFIYGGASGTPTRLGQPGNGLWGATFASSVPSWTALGTAATGNTGASGHTIPYLDVPNAWSATQSVASLLASGIVDGATPMAVSTTTPVGLGGTYNSGYTLNEHATPGQAIVFNLPTAAPGKQYCVGNAYNGSNPNTGTLDLQTYTVGQYIIFTDGTLSATGGYVISGGAAADAACVIGVDSTHWLLYVQRGSWSKH